MLVMVAVNATAYFTRSGWGGFGQTCVSRWKKEGRIFQRNPI